MTHPHGPSEVPESEAHGGPARRHFIQQIIDQDLEQGKNGGRVHTRFPPEPNGYLHIGHAKAICINFGLAEEFPGGRCNLRFDDTNPTTEDTEFVEAIQADVRWLGFDWQERLFFASDYFERLYGLAVELIEKGLAYVCDLSLEQLGEWRGDGSRPGRNSPYRERSVAENLDLFRRMRAGEFPDGAKTLRAKIDMAAANMNLRDPVLYRILHAHHHRTGSAWCIYPMYDWAHGQSDALEGITHSLCSLEFENHRPLYDWFLDHLSLPYRPRQIEFARLQLTYTVTSKRKLQQLVKEGHVTGWDDPRMPTLRGLARRGYTPEAIRAFVRTIGVARFNSTVDMLVLENALRDDLNRRAERRFAVLDPLEVLIENYPADRHETVPAVNNPEDPAAGTRPLPFEARLFIERDDFREDAPKGYFRLKPGGEVRLRYGYVIRCERFEKDAAGRVTRIHARYDPQSGGGQTADGRKVRGIIHWLPASQALPAEVRLYDHLFRVPEPGAGGGDFLADINPHSLQRPEGALIERSAAEAAPGRHFQFERLGYFFSDPRDHRPGRPVFNRAVGLKDTWAKLEARG